MTQFVKHLSKISNQFDLFIIDLWGVLHDGRAAFPSAVNVLKQLKKLDKPVALLSNAPRRWISVQERLIQLGITPNLYQTLYTSGEDCYLHFKHQLDPWYANLGDRIFHIGHEGDRHLFDKLSLHESTDIATADFILNTGAKSWKCQLKEYEEILQKAYENHLPMICTNPDKIVMFDGVEVLCAGGIAARYQELGGFVRYHGKPFKEVYSVVLKLFPGIELNRVLAIGDSLETDIQGAKSAGISSLMIIGGVHRHQFNSINQTKNHLEELEDLIKVYPFTPDFLTENLLW